MKKLSLLIALCMLISIGGVYAVWIYAGGQAINQNSNVTVQLAGVEYSGAAGTLTTEATNLLIDQESQTSYKAVLTGGVVTLTFEPDENAPAGATSGFTATITIPETTYNNSALFKVKNGVQATFDVTFTEGTDGKYIATIDIKNYVELAQEINLPTEADYNKFEEAFSKATITVTISKAANTTATT